MTDTRKPHEIHPSEGWVAHDGGPNPHQPETLLDLRFHGYDSFRTPPYIRHHEAWDNEAGAVRWRWIEQRYGRHHADISHWRPANWKYGLDAEGNLREDPYVAFRLTMQDDSRAPAARMLAAWNALNPHSGKKTVEDLPDDLVRIGDMVASVYALQPIELEFDQALAQALRISGMHRAPDEDGWHRMSNVARAVHMLVRTKDLRTIGASHSNVADALRAHPLLETRGDGNDVLVRALDPANAVVPVTTEVYCPGDVARRHLPDAHSFGAAFRALRAASGPLVADGTIVTFQRGDQVRQATWRQARGTWVTADGRALLRSDPADPVRYHYTNGHMVETAVGFVSRSSSGKLYANVGIPMDSPGDDDASVTVIDRKEAESLQDAQALLAARDDLDHILPGLQPYHGHMGFWLGSMTGSEAA